MIARIRSIWTGVTGTPWYSNLYFANDGGTDVSELAHNAVENYWAAFTGNMYDPLSISVEPDVAQIEEETGDLVGITTVAAAVIPCTAPGEPLPFSTQLLVRLRTAAFVNSRNVRGRIFIPGMMESLSTGAVPTSALVTLANTATAALFNTAAAGAPLVVWSRPAPEAETPRVGSYAQVTSSSCWDQWAVQRSRRD